MTEPPIKRAETFGVPTWRSRVPEFAVHHERVVADMRARWDEGLFVEHKYGYGYNTPTDIFSDEALAQRPYYRVLRDAFLGACARILDAREGYARKVRYEITGTQAWVRVQTPEERVFPWHHHAPAILSGCYFVKGAESLPEGEGDLMFQNPVQADIFRPGHLSVRPETGDFIIFPAYMMHMPTPSPSAKDWRISINMDAYVSWMRD